MTKFRNPVRFSEYFGIEERQLEEVGALNPTLNVDTKLFIDPLLIPVSKHLEISKRGRSVYVEHFGQVIKLLKVSKLKGDTPWRNARRLMSFPEVTWTCLGYGANSISGSGSGTFTTDHIMNTAKEIVDLGIEDPDLFVAMGLFEDKFGADRISDMTTSVTLPALLDFNERILPSLGVPTMAFTLRLPSGNSFEAKLPQNPSGQRSQPVLLVPRDILRALPIASNWSEVADVASRNRDLVFRVNQDIGQIWRLRTLKDKAEIRRRVLRTHSAFETLLLMLREVEKEPYDVLGDPSGELVWRRICETIATEHPYKLPHPKVNDVESVVQVVESIIEQFKFLVEERRLSEELYYRGTIRPEKSAQRLFFAVAYSYCRANDLDITPEADTGNGPVDFKLSQGFKSRVLVEIKLSTNAKLLQGYTRQLEAYKNAEETMRGFYVVIDVGEMPGKRFRLNETRNAHALAGEPVSPIYYIDGKRRPSASKL